MSNFYFTEDDPLEGKLLALLNGERYEPKGDEEIWPEVEISEVITEPDEKRLFRDVFIPPAQPEPLPEEILSEKADPPYLDSQRRDQLAKEHELTREREAGEKQELLESEKSESLAEVDREWSQNIGLPNEETLRRDWSRFNRKISYMYPHIVLPGWRRDRGL